MPEYLYGCPECGSTDVVRHSIYEDPALYCGKCSCIMVRKPRVGAVQFNGDGWASKEGK